MQQVFRIWKIYRIVRNILLYTFLSLLTLTIALLLLLRVPSIQNRVSQLIVSRISKSLDTRVTLQRVSISILDHIRLEGLYVGDHNNDTLLYAGKLEVNIGSINPFRKSIHLKDIDLDDCYLHMYRNGQDSVYNFAFLTGSTGDTTEEMHVQDSVQSSSSFLYSVTLNKINLKSVHFLMHDEYGSTSLDVKLPKAYINFDDLDFSGRVIAIDKMVMDDAAVSLVALRDTTPSTHTESFDTVHIALGNWILELDALRFRNSSFTYFDENATPGTEGMQFGDLAISGINFDFSDVVYAGDTILASIEDFACRDKSGFAIDTFSTQLRFTPYEITCADLLLTTPHSVIRDSLSLNFSTLNDFDRFIDDIQWNANLKSARISSIDLAYFIPAASSYDAMLAISTAVRGPLSNLHLHEMDLSLNEAAGLQGDATIRGLPVPEETFIDIDLQSLYAKTSRLENIIGPGKLPGQVLQMGTLNYSGRITGFIYDLVAFGTLTTEQGAITTDLHFDYNKDTHTSEYSGHVSTTHLNIGLLAGEPDILGLLSMNASVDGKILNGTEPVFNVDGKIDNIGIRQYDYENVVLHGEIRSNYFQGNFTVDDPNLHMDFKGLLDFRDSIPLYDFATNIYRANLKRINLYKDDIVFSSTANLQAEGKTIDELLGTASFGNLYVIEGRNIYRLDTLNIFAKNAGQGKSLSARSNLIDFDVTGDYKLSRLPAAISQMIKYYVEGPSPGNPPVPAGNGTFSVHIENADKLAAIFYPDIHVVHQVHITGDFNAGEEDLSMRFRADQLQYRNFLADTLLLEARTDANKFAFSTKLNKIYTGKTNYIPVTRIDGDFSKDSLNYTLKIGRDIDSNRLDLHGQVFIRDSLLAMNILPSEIYFNGEKWNILPNNSLQYINGQIYADHFMLASGDKTIQLSSITENGENALNLQVKDFPVGNLAETFLLTGEHVSGTLNANFKVKNIFSAPAANGYASVRDFTINDHLYGNVNITASLVQPSMQFRFITSITGVNGLNASGYYNLGKGNDSLSVDLAFANTHLWIIEPFTEGLMSGLKGDINGELTMNGTTRNLDMAGKLSLARGAATVDYLNTTYSFDSLQVNITKNRITIPKTNIYDALRNSGTLQGEITYSNFSNWNFRELHLRSDKILFMNTTEKMNPDFFGYAIGKADANITGTLDNLTITVNATPLHILPSDSTVIYLPTYGSGDIKRHNFIRFINPEKTAAQQENINVSEVNVDMYLNITPDASVKVLISPDGSEVLEGKGYGNLHIFANTTGTVTMDGTFEISEGNYSFSFENLIKRKFTVDPGGTIKFNGNPYQAELNLTAVNTVENVSVSNLLGESAAVSGTSANQKIDVDVLIYITGSLSSPDINFDIRLPESQNQLSSLVAQRVEEIKADKNELNKQVFGLLITRNFLPEDLKSTNPVGSTVNNTMNEFLSSQITSYFQGVLDKYLKDAEVDFGYQNLQSGNYNYTDQQGNQFNIDVQKQVNNNIIVKVGTTYYDYAPTGTGESSTSNLAGDFEVDYLITPDGRIRVKAFRTSEYDAVIAKNDVKTGVGIYYTKEFNKFSDLFKKKKTSTQQ